MTKTTYVNAIYLGNFASVDTNENDYDAEHEAALKGVTVDHGTLQVVSLRLDDRDHNGTISDDECNPYCDKVTYDIGSGQVSNQTDATLTGYVTLTLGDGSTRTVEALLTQQANGDLFLNDLLNCGTLDNLQISSVTIDSFTCDNYAGWYTNQSVDNTSIVAPAPAGDGIVEGTAGDDVIDVAYTGDPEGDRIDAGDALAPNSGDEDIVDAGCGDDDVHAGAANDEVYAGGGDDTVFGDAGNDTIYGDRSLGEADNNGDAKVLDWGSIGDGTGIVEGCPVDIDADGINVHVSFDKQDYGATAKATSTRQYVDTASGETFDTNSALELFGKGGEGGWDNTSTTRLDFSATNAAYSDEVQNVAFRINDIDEGTSSDDHIDRVTIRAFDAQGNAVDVQLTAGSFISLSGDTATGDENLDTDYGPDDARGSLLVEIAGPVSYIEIDYDNGECTDQKVWVSDVHFDTIGTVADCPPGDDSLLGGAGDDVIYGEDGHDTLYGDEGDDRLLGGVGNDTLDGGAGNDILRGNADRDVIFAGGGDDVDGGSAGDDHDILDLTGQGTYYLENVTADTNGNGFNGTVVFVDGEGTPTGETINFVEIEEIRGTEFNRGPDAVDDSVTGDEDTVITGNVLANDTDPDSDPLTVVSNTDPANGAVTVNPDGSFEYTPNPDFNGTDSFTYTVSDGQGGTDTATVTITVGAVNDDPDAVNDSAATPFDTPIVVDVLGNDTDPENDPLTVIGTTDGANGTVALDPVTGNPVYTPNPGFAGTDQFTYTISDGNGGTDTATVTITVEPDPRDGIVEGTGGDDLIDVAYTGDPEGDMIDAGDAILPGDAPNDDVVEAGDGNDTVLAGVGDDEVYGGAGNDELLGEDGDDSLYGEEGDDTLRGGMGDDLIDGGDGNDSVRANEGEDTVIGGAGNDTLRGGEDNDTVDGGAGDDLLYGGLGDDSVLGGDGDDELRGNEGSDTLLGGDGNDSIAADDPGDVLDAETFVGVPFEEFPDTENNRDYVDGGAGNDTIDGGDDADTLIGGTGDDVIEGGIDNDSITGNDGNDSITDIQGADFIDGGAGDDTIIAGVDTFSDYVGDDPNLPNPLLIDPTTGLPALSDPNTDDGKDTVLGGDGNDFIATGDDADYIDGGADNDTIDAGIDDDTVIGGSGDDSIIGGHGSDSILGEEGDDWINAGDSSLLFGQAPDASDPVPTNGRDFVDGGAGNDTIFGEDDEDTLLGGDGDDVIDGGIDDDLIEGGDGDDILSGAADEDTLLGGAGNDIILAGTEDDLVEGNDGVDVILGEEGDDTLLGGADTDLVLGGTGDDLIEGGSGVDILDGEDGDDTVDGGDDTDLIFGEAGQDLLTGGGGSDIVLGGTDGDLIYGDGIVDEGNTPDGDADILFGEEGDDTIFGGAGDDLIDGGEGADEMRGGDDQDTFIEVGPGDVIDGGEGGVDFDTMVLSAPANIIYDPLNPENGTIEFIDLETQTVFGTATFRNIENIEFVQPDVNPAQPANDENSDPDTQPEDVVIDYNPPVSPAPAPPPSAPQPEGHVDGTSGSDLIGPGYVDIDGDEIDAGDAILSGEFGDDDIVRAYDGDDTVDAGLGDDEVFGGDGDDSIDGNAGDDVLRGQDGDDTILGGEGDDRIDGGDGDDLGDGGAGDDTVVGRDGDDIVYGGDGNDFVTGDDGDDSVFGGAGNDLLLGGDGNDTIDGGDDDNIDRAAGGDDADLFTGFGAGDTVEGGSGGADYDTLDLTGTAPAGGSLSVTITGPDSNGNGSDGFVTYFDATGSEIGRLDFTEIEEIVPCFTPGTTIATPQGERLIEDLKTGDRVITRDNGIQEIRWIGAKPVTGVELAKNPHLKPVLIRKGALGNGLPERDMLVSPNHRLLVNNDKTALYFEEREVLAAAKHLVGADGIHEVDVMSTTYIHFMFDHHEVVLSNGSWTESFQPGDMSLKGVGNAQRNEIFELFPELRTREGIDDYQAARRALKKHEAKLLIK
ncbi:Hint domain-containing protein [Lutimaribacter saemankumensis]|uniref:Ca2+-binding protein, RTX toxin-related n=1 Tax=Lutimaribacter saemankumensis TaxID=490829 RepID=A0A1G8S651_9RHOB|nr:Hint domain-containing protein [Lutimaribacter saemankumensis]SDJ24653.1 Ca2+-binding protein, RTX toxin-related [Lutimaribacter saemankumensis]